jgi:predicted nucleic acid-binding protein
LTIHLDTSALIAAFASPRPAADTLERLGAEGHVLALSTPVLFEWLRGPRTAWELSARRRVITQVVPFDAGAAEQAAAIYLQLTRHRYRDIDIAIAACAIEHNASLWTLNVDDFSDIPGLTLYQP